MPRTNIVWVKLKLELFENDRFLYQLNERQQLLYVKLLYLAGRTVNRIPKNMLYIAHKVNYMHGEDNFERDIQQIQSVFPKFIDNDDFYSFENFDKIHNYIEIQKGDTLGVPEGGRKNKKRIRKDNIYGETTNKVFNYFCSKWEDKNGKRYAPNYGKDKKIFKDLLKEHSDTDICKCIDRFFTQKDDFAKQVGYTVGVFKSQFNRLRVKKSGGITQF